MEFRILGSLQVVVQGGEEVPLASAKQRALLAVLLLHAGAVVSRERLIEELWGDSPPATAAKALSVYVSRLRKLLGRGAEMIATRPAGYALRIDRERLDAVLFERRVEEARRCSAAGDIESARGLLSEALRLWRGRVLEDVELNGSTRNEVGRLEELRLGAELDRLDCDLALGLHERVIGELEALVSEHPLRERLRRQLMLALYRSGRQADALDVYRETCRMLRDELGLEPAPALRELERSILRHDPRLDLPSERPPRPQPARRRSAHLRVGTYSALLDTLAAELGAYGRLNDYAQKVWRMREEDD